MSTTVYKKEGDKFIDIGELDKAYSYGYFPYGNWLVTSEPTFLSSKPITPANVLVQAALENCRDELIKAFVEISSLQIKHKNIAEEKLAALTGLQKEIRDAEYKMYHESAYNVFEKFFKCINDKITPILENETVKNAYDEFMLIYALVNNEHIKEK